MVLRALTGQRQQKPHADRHGEHRGAAIRDERQGHALGRPHRLDEVFMLLSPILLLLHLRDERSDIQTFLYEGKNM